MLCTDHGPSLINSLLLCAQTALLNGTVSNRDVINVLDVAQDLISITVSSSAYNEKNIIHSSKEQPAPRYAPYDSGLPLSDRIQIARENLGLSEADLARQLGTYSDHISDWERGITEPPASMVIPLANALKCDPLWLLGYSESNVPVKVMQHVDVSTIGKRIGVARVENHMNTQELEEMIGAPDGTVFRWETGKAIPSSQYIDNLAKALNTSVTWLLTGKITPQASLNNGEQQHHHASQQAGGVSHEALQQ